MLSIFYPEAGSSPQYPPALRNLRFIIAATDPAVGLS